METQSKYTVHLLYKGDQYRREINYESMISYLVYELEKISKQYPGEYTFIVRENLTGDIKELLTLDTRKQNI